MKKFTPLLITLSLITPALANTATTPVDAFVKQHYLSIMRVATSALIDFAPKKPTKKQLTCINKTLNDNAEKLDATLTANERKAIEALLTTNFGKSMQDYNSKVTSVTDKHADTITFLEARSERYENAPKKEVKIAEKADEVLQKILMNNEDFLDELPHTLSKHCGIDITQRN